MTFNIYGYNDELNRFKDELNGGINDVLELQIVLANICKDYKGKKPAEENNHIYEEELAMIAELRNDKVEEFLIKILRQYCRCRISVSEQIAFNAFYTLHILYRRRKSQENLDKLMKDYEALFVNHRIISHLKIMQRMEVHNEDEPVSDKMVEDAWNDVELFSNQSGVRACLCDVVVTICEKKMMAEENVIEPSDDYKEFSEKWLPRALENILVAIDLSPQYAKYYALYARYLSLSEKFDEAMDMLNKARNMELDTGNYYSNKMMEFNLIQSQIETRKLMHSLKLTSKQLGNETEECRNTINLWTHRNLEFLALFAAAVSFIIAGITIGASVDATPKEIAGLMLLLFGCTASVLTMFDGIISVPIGRKKRRKYIIVGIMCVLLILTGIFMMIFQPGIMLDNKTNVPVIFYRIIELR